MSVVEKQTGLDELKTRLRNTWTTGDYGRFSRYMERDAEAFYPAPAHQAGRAVARCRMRRGATVTDCGESGGACDGV